METFTMFPQKIRALVVDNDVKFLKSCCTVLSLLNFKVTTYRKHAAAALSLLLGSKSKDVDVLLVEAEKAAIGGFDFRGIVEPNLSIPVIYYYHEATGDKVNAIRRKLGSGTYTIRKPLHVDDVRHLGSIIAWRKCCLEMKPNLHAGSNNVTFPSTAAFSSYGRGQKRKNDSADPGSSSGAGGHYSAMGEQQIMNMQGQERVNLLASQQLQLAPQEHRVMEAMKNNGKAPMVQQEAQAMDADRQKLRQSVLESVLRALDMPEYNPSPSIFADAAGPSNNVAACAGVSYTAGQSSLPHANTPIFPAQAPPPPYPPPPPARTPVYQGPVPSPFYLFPPRSHGTGPIMLNFQQPQAGDLFTGTVTGGATTFGASAIAPQTGAYNGNVASSSLLHDQSLNHGTDDQNELSAMVAMYNGPNPNPPMAPQNVGDRPNEAATATLYNNNYTNYSAGALAAPPPQHVGHDAAAFAAAVKELEALLNSDDSISTGSHDQVLGMASYLNDELTMAGPRAFGSGSDAAASSVAPHQDLAAAAPNGTDVAPGAMLDDDTRSNGTGAAMEGNPCFEKMFPDADDDFTFSLEELMALLDEGQSDDGASATGGTNTGTDVAGTSQTGGDEGMGIRDIGAADLGNFMFPPDVNKGSNK